MPGSPCCGNPIPTRPAGRRVCSSGPFVGEGEGTDVRGLNHAALLVGDVERSRRFYGEVLGLAEVARPETFDFPGAWFRRGDADIHLIGESEPGRAAEMHPGYADEEIARGYGTHIAFEVASLEDAQRRLAERDVPLAGGPRPRGDGVQQIYVRDPDGYVVELFSWEG